MSSPEAPLDAEAERQRFEFISHYIGATISFADFETPKLNGGDPDRLCTIFGTLVSTYASLEGLFAVIDVSSHAIQQTSVEAVAPGHKDLFNSFFAGSSAAESLAGAMEEGRLFDEQHPEVTEYTELPLEEPTRRTYRVGDLHAFVIGFSPDDSSEN